MKWSVIQSIFYYLIFWSFNIYFQIQIVPVILFSVVGSFYMSWFEVLSIYLLIVVQQSIVVMAFFAKFKKVPSRLFVLWAIVELPAVWVVSLMLESKIAMSSEIDLEKAFIPNTESCLLMLICVAMLLIFYRDMLLLWYKQNRIDGFAKVISMPIKKFRDQVSVKL